MQYQKIINMLDDTLNQSTKLRAKEWVEINDDAYGMHNANSQIESKTSMLNSSLCDYSDAYILVSGTTTVAPKAVNNPNNDGKGVVFKNCAPFTDSISEINNIQIDNTKDIDIVMPMHNSIERSNNYSKTLGSLLQLL